MALHLRALYNCVKAKCNDEIELIAGEDGLDKAVQCINVAEGIEDSNLSKENEVAFITGIALKNESDLLNLVKYIFACGESGIVINVGTYIKEICPEIIDFCNEKLLPLFRVQMQTGTARIMKMFSEKLMMLDRQNMELTSAVKNALYSPNNYDLYVPTLERYNYDSEWLYDIVVCECTDKNGDDAKNDDIESIKIFIENFMLTLDQNVIVFTTKNQIIMFFGNIDEKIVENIIDSMIGVLPDHIKENFNIYIGIGKNIKGMHCINKSFIIADKIAKMQRKKMAASESESYYNLGILRLFLDIEDEEIMREFYTDVLGPLVKYDEINRTDFVGFLKAYFVYGCHVRETAKGMYLHRNSINYKLRRIEEILNCEFSDINTKAQILIALKLMDIF